MTAWHIDRLPPAEGVVGSQPLRPLPAPEDESEYARTQLELAARARQNGDNAFESVAEPNMASATTSSNITAASSAAATKWTGTPAQGDIHPTSHFQRPLQATDIAPISLTTGFDGQSKLPPTASTSLKTHEALVLAVESLPSSKHRQSRGRATPRDLPTITTARRREDHTETFEKHRKGKKSVASTPRHQSLTSSDTMARRISLKTKPRQSSRSPSRSQRATSDEDSVSSDISSPSDLESPPLTFTGGPTIEETTAMFQAILAASRKLSQRRQSRALDPLDREDVAAESKKAVNDGVSSSRDPAIEAPEVSLPGDVVLREAVTQTALKATLQQQKRSSEGTNIERRTDQQLHVQLGLSDPSAGEVSVRSAWASQRDSMTAAPMQPRQVTVEERLPQLVEGPQEAAESLSNDTPHNPLPRSRSPQSKRKGETPTHGENVFTSEATDSFKRMEATADKSTPARFRSQLCAPGAEEQIALSAHSQLGSQQPGVVPSEDSPPSAPSVELRLDSDCNGSVSSIVSQASQRAHSHGTDHMAPDQSYAEDFAQPRQDARSRPAEEHCQLNLDYGQPLASKASAREGCLQDLWGDFDISSFHEEEPPLWLPASAKAQTRRARNRDAIVQQITLAGTALVAVHQAVDGDLAAEPPTRGANQGPGFSVHLNGDTPNSAKSPSVVSMNGLLTPASRLSADLDVASGEQTSAADLAQDHGPDAIQGKEILLKQSTSQPLANELPSVGAPHTIQTEVIPLIVCNNMSLPLSSALNDASHSDTTRAEESLDKEDLSRAESVPGLKTLLVAPSVAEQSLAEGAVGPTSSTDGFLLAVQANSAKEIVVDLPGLQTTQSQDDVGGSNWVQCSANRESHQNECDTPLLAPPPVATACQIELLEATHLVEASQESMTAHASEMLVEDTVTNSGPANRETASRQTADYSQPNVEQVETAQDVLSIAVTHQKPPMRISPSSLSSAIGCLSSPKKAVPVGVLSACVTATSSRLLSEIGDISCAYMPEPGDDVFIPMLFNGASNIADGQSMDGEPRAQTAEAAITSKSKDFLEVSVSLPARTNSSATTISEIAPKEVDQPPTPERVSGNKSLSATSVNGQTGRRNVALKAEETMRKRCPSLEALKKRQKPREISTAEDENLSNFLRSEREINNCESDHSYDVGLRQLQSPDSECQAHLFRAFRSRHLHQLHLDDASDNSQPPQMSRKLHSLRKIRLAFEQRHSSTESGNGDDRRQKSPAVHSNGVGKFLNQADAISEYAHGIIVANVSDGQFKTNVLEGHLRQSLAEGQSRTALESSLEKSNKGPSRAQHRLRLINHSVSNAESFRSFREESDKSTREQRSTAKQQRLSEDREAFENEQPATDPVASSDHDYAVKKSASETPASVANALDLDISSDDEDLVQSRMQTKVNATSKLSDTYAKQAQPASRPMHGESAHVQPLGKFVNSLLESRRPETNGAYASSAKGLSTSFDGRASSDEFDPIPATEDRFSCSRVAKRKRNRSPSTCVDPAEPDQQLPKTIKRLPFLRPAVPASLERISMTRSEARARIEALLAQIVN